MNEKILVGFWWILHSQIAHKLVSKIGFIIVHGLHEGHIAPYTDIEFQLTKTQTYIIMKSKTNRYNCYLKKLLHYWQR